MKETKEILRRMEENSAMMKEIMEKQVVLQQLLLLELKEQIKEEAAANE